MRLSVENVLGIERADLDLHERITLVAARNRQGKSSLLTALRAVLLEQAAPLTGKKSRDADLITRQGAKSGRVRFSSGDAFRSIFWPKGEMTTKGDLVLNVSAYSLGAPSLPRMPPDQRKRAFAALFGAAPNRGDLDHAVAEHEADIPDDLVEQTWRRVEGEDWDGAQVWLEGQAREFKGQWRQAAGEQWGDKKAEGWEPVALINRVAELEADLKQARKNAGATPDDEPDTAEVEAARQGFDAARRALDEAHKVRSALPHEPGEAFQTLTCGHCGKPTDYARTGDGRLVPAMKLSSADLKKIRQDIATADGLLSRREGELGQARHRLQKAEACLTAAHKPADHSVAIAETRLEEARRQVEDARTETARLHVMILQHLELAEIVGPSGIRSAKLKRVLEMINEALDERAQGFGLPAGLALDEALDVWLGTRPWVVLSESERWLVEATLALEIAHRRGHDLVVLDRADVLDRRNRNAFFRSLSRPETPRVILAMTMSAPDVVPDLGSKGLGRCYWIEAGVVEELAREREAA